MCKIQLLNGGVYRIQNWQIDPLVYNNTQWIYLPFPIPSFSKKLGEDAQTLQVVLPNIGSDRYGYLPIRDWISEGIVSGAYVTFYIFTDISQSQHVYRIAEQTFDDAQGQESWIKLNLRQPDDADALVLTGTFTNSLLGASARYALA